MKFNPHGIVMNLLPVALLAGFAQAAPKPDDLLDVRTLQRTLTAVADDVRPSVVAIRALRQNDPDDGDSGPDNPGERSRRRGLIPSEGTGIIISSEGLILTSEHVVHNARLEDIQCRLANGRRYDVQGMTTDPRSDLAVLRIDAHDLTPARLGDLGGVRQGQFVVAMGNPFGSSFDSDGQPSLTFGVVSGLGRDLTTQLDPNRYYGNLIQTDARINPGHSGGPLINLDGEVIGVNAAISSRTGSSQGVGFAIPIDAFTRSLIERLSRGELIEYGYLGVVMTEGGSGWRDRPAGAYVSSVRSGTPAQVAGLRPGDIITGFNGRDVTSMDSLIRLVSTANVGEQAGIAVLRDNRVLSFDIRPSRRGDVPRGVTIEKPIRWRDMTLSNPTADVLNEFNLPAAIEGVVITQVATGSAAGQSGLEPGDVILEFNDEPLRSVRRILQIDRTATGDIELLIAAESPRKVTLR